MTEWEIYLWFGIKYTTDRLNWFNVSNSVMVLYADDGFGCLQPVSPPFVSE